jgi:hypothetical protein
MEIFEEKSTANTDQPKKNYHSPQLFIYGDIRQMTQSVDFSGHTDGGSGFLMTKT